jgi:hypothetical protein
VLAAREEASLRGEQPAGGRHITCGSSLYQRLRRLLSLAMGSCGLYIEGSKSPSPRIGGRVFLPLKVPNRQWELSHNLYLRKK